ncbi:MAG: hypothetical protein LKF79_05285, partial [Solobacterium sp.]|nr:hypothetical protein [Solobacterium sp.]
QRRIEYKKSDNVLCYCKYSKYTFNKNKSNLYHNNIVDSPQKAKSAKVKRGGKFLYSNLNINKINSKIFKRFILVHGQYCKSSISLINVNDKQDVIIPRFDLLETGQSVEEIVEYIIQEKWKNPGS